MRVDLYRTIHKAQRFHLLRFGARLGCTDMSDGTEVAVVDRELRALVDELRDHAENERRYIHPLFGAVGAVHDLDREHDELDGVLSELIDGGAETLYPRFMRFLVSYLAHIDEEERLQAEILWVRCAEAELAATFHRFVTERAPDSARHDLVFILPALSLPGRVAIFRGMRRSAPADTFAGAVALARDTLGADAWAAIAARLDAGRGG